MNTATIINIVLCILSFLLAMISIITVVITLKQNSKMMENSSRGYLSVYGDMLGVQPGNFYIVVKNFGHSNVLIKSLKCDADLDMFSFIETVHPLSHIENTTVAPNQKFKYPLVQTTLFASGLTSINFEISYESIGKIYSEKYSIHLDAYRDILSSKTSIKEDNALKVISFSLQEINEQLL